MDPMMAMLAIGALMQVGVAIMQVMASKTPEEKDAALKALDDTWAAASLTLSSHVPGAKARLDALARGENPYAATMTQAIRGSQPGPTV